MSKFQSAELRYTGPAFKPGDGIPTPQGWPAADHEEPDKALYKEKIASGFYAPVGDAPASDSPVTGGEV